eukprot:762657-Hanusia_phi.AAC.1
METLVLRGGGVGPADASQTSRASSHNGSPAATSTRTAAWSRSSTWVLRAARRGGVTCDRVSRGQGEQHGGSDQPVTEKRFLRSVEYMQGATTRRVFRITLLGVGNVCPFTFARSLLPRHELPRGCDKQPVRSQAKDAPFPLVISRVAAAAAKNSSVHLIVESVNNDKESSKDSDCIVILFSSHVRSSFSLAWVSLSCRLQVLTRCQDSYTHLSGVNQDCPILFAEVNNKTSEDVDDDIAIQSPSETCAFHRLPAPLRLSHDGLASLPPFDVHSAAGEADSDFTLLWTSVLDACLHPHKSSPVLADKMRKVRIWCSSLADLPYSAPCGSDSLSSLATLPSSLQVSQLVSPHLDLCSCSPSLSRSCLIHASQV